METARDLNMETDEMQLVVSALRGVGKRIVEVAGTIGKRAIRFIGSHLRFPAPSFFFHCKDNPGECRGELTYPLLSAACLMQN